MSTDPDTMEQPVRIDTYLRVGMPCMCYPGPDGDSGRYHKAILRGWQNGSFLIAELVSAEEERVTIPPDTPCLFKFRNEGATWCFDTAVSDSWETATGTNFRFNWPANFREAALRKHERIDINLPCNAVYEETGTWVKGQIRDLGAGGARLCVKTPPSDGSPVHLSFSLPDGTTLEDVRAVVRSAVPYGKGAFLGIQFDEAEASASKDVELFVSTQLERKRSFRRGARRVLVIERNPKIAAGIRRALERRGFDVATAAGLVDGFAMLRNLLPSVLMTNVEAGHLAGTDICRIIRSTPGFRKLPVFLYGPRDSGLEDRANEVGASGYLPFTTQSNRLVASMVEAEMDPETDPAQI